MEDKEKVQGKRGYFDGSVKNLKSVKAIAISGMLLALHLVLAFFLGIYLTQTVKFSIAFLTNVVTAYLFGPWMALITGALGDILQYLMKPVGGYFFGWTLNAALGGLLYGLFLYRKAPKEIDATLESENKKRNLINVVSSLILLVFTAIGWFGMPFLKIVTKVTAEEPEAKLISEGSAFEFMKKFFQGVNDKDAGLIAFVLLLLLIAVFVLMLFKKHMPAMAVAAIALLWSLLPVYSDRKEMLAQQGFVFVTIGFVAFMVSALLQILWKKSVDGLFLLRCFIVMAINAVVVQMILGTEWCVIMYGKGFNIYFTSRAIKSLIQLPVNTVLCYYILKALRRLRITE